MTAGGFRYFIFLAVVCSTFVGMIQLRDLFRETPSAYMPPPVLIRPKSQELRAGTNHQQGTKPQSKAQQQAFALLPSGLWQSTSKFRLLESALTRMGSAFDFCPRTYGTKLDKLRPPTITLTPIGGGLEPAEAELGRTTFMSPESLASQDLSEIGFLPWKLGAGDLTPHFITPIGLEGYDGLAEVEERTADKGWKSPPCLTYSVPASPSLPHFRTKMSRLMFGMSTAPDRIITSIPVWEDWLSSVPYDQPLPFLLIHIDQREAESDVAWEAEQQLLSAQKAGTLDAMMKGNDGARMERRYLALVKHMWIEARAREEMKEGDGLSANVDWFVVADDDTYFLGLPALSKAVESYDPKQPYIIGSLSENPRQVAEWGHIAYGGASIILSRGLVQMMNENDNFEKCEEKFGHLFGGDAMITSCAAMVMGTNEEEVVTQLPILHQFDIEHDASGLIQAGSRFATLHHWKSWMQLFPLEHPNTIHDPTEAVRLIGKVARAIGASNWGRRYVWGMSEQFEHLEKNTDKDQVAEVINPTVVISLGYSITIYGQGVMNKTRLGEVEHTFQNPELFIPTRPNIEEGKLKRSYFLVDAQILSYTEGTGRADVIVMRHVDEKGHMIDLIWDSRDESKKAGLGKQLWQGVKGRVQNGWK